MMISMSRKELITTFVGHLRVIVHVRCHPTSRRLVELAVAGTRLLFVLDARPALGSPVVSPGQRQVVLVIVLMLGRPAED